ncbi:MAG TPA: hypothetical protein PLD59_05645 [Tepidisphaeraceae bacterium]|nr:hypothetical protein [Tepidisphaeraceae bacterium]
MSAWLLNLGRDKYVIVPKEDHDQLETLARRQVREDAADSAIARRRNAKGSSKPYGELRKQLGLE